MIKHNMPNAEYHAHAAFSKSTLSDFYSAATPAHFKAIPKKETASLNFGTACHLALLEPDLFNDMVVVPPSEVLSKSGSRAGKAWYEWKAVQDDNDRVILKAEEKKHIEHIQEAVFQKPFNREAAELLTGGLSEISFFWNDWETSLPAKCRPDKLPGSNIIVDLKTAETASPDEFSKACANFKYGWSVVLSCEGVTECTQSLHNDYRFVVVEKSPPYGCMVYKLDPVEIELYRVQLQRVKQDYAKCVVNDYWPCYPDGTHTLNIPYWEKKKLEVAIYD